MVKKIFNYAEMGRRIVATFGREAESIERAIGENWNESQTALLARISQQLEILNTTVEMIPYNIIDKLEMKERRDRNRKKRAAKKREKALKNG